MTDQWWIPFAFLHKVEYVDIPVRGPLLPLTVLPNVEKYNHDSSYVKQRHEVDRRVEHLNQNLINGSILCDIAF